MIKEVDADGDGRIDFLGKFSLILYDDMSKKSVNVRNNKCSYSGLALALQTSRCVIVKSFLWRTINWLKYNKNNDSVDFYN